ncbi:MAG: class I SAM-dependent methyltransferase, partial [Planctomycetes bacterium]|nr:class I SAM-dependent methyltransferase [Planctomycetota bacterium]
MKRIALVALALLATSLSVAKAQDAKQILDASGVNGGLVVVIGCDNPALLAQLRAGDSYLVHGLDRNPGKVAVARRYLRESGLCGSIAVARWDGSQLPYVDSLVNLIVVTGGVGQISEDEMTRVLAPLGVIADARKERIEITRKPWPAELDEWTHFLHDATNNAVSSDTVVDPPQGLRWTCGPEYARSHEHFAS